MQCKSLSRQCVWTLVLALPWLASPFWLAPSSRAAEPISEAEFRKLHAELQPEADDPWRTIPWETSLLEAQRQACSSQKPIFIWAMDGHPLGCT